MRTVVRSLFVLLTAVTLVALLTVPAMAGSAAPCTSNNPHGTITYTSHGKTHARVLKKHVWTTDTYNVYEWSGYYWVWVGNQQCYYGPFH